MAHRVVVVGAGLAGLACARRLVRAGCEVILLEASDRPGGRLKTDRIDGFTLDHGFQVLFTAYPAARSELDYHALDLRKFEAGSLIWDGAKTQEVHRDRLFAMAFSRYLGMGDKLRVLAFSEDTCMMSSREIWDAPDQTSESAMRDFGFSERFLDRFARPFFGGIFLDRSLLVSSRMMRFVWQMLHTGDTVVPALGMDRIPEQLRSCEVRCGARVATVSAHGVRLEDGSELEADRVVVTTPGPESARLLGLAPPAPGLASTCLYFECPEPPVDRPILVLNGPGAGYVNHVAPVSRVSPATAPAGRHLASATVLGEDATPGAVLAELDEWFPRHRPSRTWEHLATYRIAYAQMAQPPGFAGARPGHRTAHPGVYLAGESTDHGSIEGALASGVRCATVLLHDLVE